MTWIFKRRHDNRAEQQYERGGDTKICFCPINGDTQQREY